MNQKRRVIALGFFDGVHLGHGSLLRRVKECSAQLEATASVMSFDIHPSALLMGRSVPLINTVEDRVWLMRNRYAMEDVILAHFDQRMMHQPWEHFVSDYLVEELGAVHVVAGHDYRFGDRGTGNAQRLRSKCAELGIGCDILGMVELDGEAVHSTHIRRLLSQGDMENANRFLGHPHTFSAAVGQGKGLGHVLGFPTVNLQFPPDLLIPAFGVYAAKVYVDGARYLAAANIGVRPTVEDSNKVNLEAFLLDYHGDLYGKELRIEFFHHLRGEKKFPSVEALTAEVLRNAEQVREYFSQREELL